MMSFTAFVVFGFSPLGHMLMLPLENRFPVPPSLKDGDVNGIIFLGGFEDGNISKARNTLSLVASAERLSETVRLARQLPSSKVVFTGGAAVILLPGHDARQAVSKYLKDVGIDSDRLILEGDSRNTWENAIFTLRLLKPKPNDRFLLVTSCLLYTSPSPRDA